MKNWWLSSALFVSLSLFSRLNAETPPASEKPSAPPDCLLYTATPLSSPLLFANKKAYFVSPKLASDAGAATSYLIEVDLEAGKARRVAGFKSGRFVSVLAHGPKPEAITVVDFSTGRAECGEGLANGTSIFLNEQKVVASYPTAQYGLVSSDGGPQLADFDRATIQTVDLATKQKRTLESFQKGLRPLYIKVSPPPVSYRYDHEAHELRKVIANKKIAAAALKLKEGMRLVQDKEKFGIVQEKGQALQLLAIKDWSGTEMKTVELMLPQGFLPSDVGVKPKFDSGETLVFGKSDEARRTQKSVLHYTGATLKTWKAPDASSYFSAAEFAPDGSVTLLLNEMNTAAVREIWKIAKGAEPKKIDVLKPGAAKIK